MIYALSWLLIFSLLALWSLAVWVVNSIAVGTVSNTGTLTGATSAVEGLLQVVPALAGGLTMAAWVIWAVGSAPFVLLGAGLHLLITMWRRSIGRSGPQPARQAAA